MSKTKPIENFDLMQKRIIELAIRLGALIALVIWCFTIVQPFVMMVIGGVIVAIALYPFFTKLSFALGGRKNLTAVLLSLVLIGLIVVPAIMLTGSLVDGAQAIVAAGEADELKLSDPPARVAELPLIGPRVYSYWQRAVENPPAVIREIKPQIKALGGWLLTLVSGTGLSLLRFSISFCIAGVLLATASDGERASRTLAKRLAGNRGQELTVLTVGTIRSVAIGILAVSLLQTALLSLGFVVAGLPAAGLLALIVLILCVVQLGPSLISIPTVLYMYSTTDILPATIFAIWTLVMTFIDSILKPLIFGRGASVPTWVIFLGAIGGMIAYGIIGLFIGAVVLSVGYKLYEAWLDETALEDEVVGSADSPQKDCDTATE
jgi:predicted PurR-regulated permease PerM